MKAKVISFLIIGIVLLSSCKGKSTITPEQRAKNEDKAIQTYIKKHHLDAKKDEYGIYYVIKKEGEGSHPIAADKVTVSYKGYTLQGDVFDKSDKTGVTFSLQRVIAGWRAGIPYFRVGGSGILIIPSHLAYGEEGKGNVKPNTVLVFDVNLLAIDK